MELNYNIHPDSHLRSSRRVVQPEPSGDTCTQLQRLALLYQSRGCLAEAQEIHGLMRQIIHKRTTAEQNCPLFGIAD